MRTCASVDLPEPLGPMIAWTSPDRTVRSMPRRISLPATPARRPLISSTWEPFVSRIGQDHHDLAVVDAHVVHGDRPGGRQGQGLAVGEGELAAVLPALDGELVGIDLALGERHVLVRADVVEDVDLVVDAHDRELVVADVVAPGGPGGDVVERPQCDLGHQASLRANLSAMVPRSTGATSGTGSRPSTSSKKPPTMRRSASSVGTPRLSR